MRAKRGWVYVLRLDKLGGGAVLRLSHLGKRLAKLLVAAWCWLFPAGFDAAQAQANAAGRRDQLFRDSLGAGHNAAEVFTEGNSSLHTRVVRGAGKVVGPWSSYAEGRSAGGSVVDSVARATLTEGTGALIGVGVGAACTGVTAGFGVAACAGGGMVIKQVTSEILGNEWDKMIKTHGSFGGALGAAGGMAQKALEPLVRVLQRPPETIGSNALFRSLVTKRPRPPDAIGGSASARAANPCAFDYHKVGMSQLSCYNPPAAPRSSGNAADSSECVRSVLPYVDGNLAAAQDACRKGFIYAPGNFQNVR